MNDDFTKIDDWPMGKPAYADGRIPLGPHAKFMELAHRQGASMKVYPDHFELWVPQTVKPPWWAFWRKPVTEPRMVARAEGQPTAGDIMQLFNEGETFFATVNGEKVLVWPKP